MIFGSFIWSQFVSCKPSRVDSHCMTNLSWLIVCWVFLVLGCVPSERGKTIVVYGEPGFPRIEARQEFRLEQARRLVDDLIRREAKPQKARYATVVLCDQEYYLFATSVKPSGIPLRGWKVSMTGSIAFVNEGDYIPLPHDTKVVDLAYPRRKVENGDGQKD